MYEIVSFLINGGKNKFPCHVKEKLTPKVQDKPQFFVRYQTLANVTCDNNIKKKEREGQKYWFAFYSHFVSSCTGRNRATFRRLCSCQQDSN